MNADVVDPEINSDDIDNPFCLLLSKERIPEGMPKARGGLLSIT